MIYITFLTFFVVFYFMQLLSLFSDIYIESMKMTTWEIIKRLIPFNNLKRTLTPYWNR